MRFREVDEVGSLAGVSFGGLHRWPLLWVTRHCPRLQVTFPHAGLAPIFSFLKERRDATSRRTGHHTDSARSHDQLVPLARILRPRTQPAHLSPHTQSAHPTCTSRQRTPIAPSPHPTHLGSKFTRSTTTLSPFPSASTTCRSHSCLRREGASSWETRVQALVRREGLLVPSIVSEPGVTTDPDPEARTAPHWSVSEAATRAFEKVDLALPGRPTRTSTTCCSVPLDCALTSSLAT